MLPTCPLRVTMLLVALLLPACAPTPDSEPGDAAASQEVPADDAQPLAEEPEEAAANPPGLELDLDGFRYFVQGAPIGSATSIGGVPAPPGEVYVSVELSLTNLLDDRPAFNLFNFDAYAEFPKDALPPAAECFQLPEDTPTARFGTDPKWATFTEHGYKTARGFCLRATETVVGQLTNHQATIPAGSTITGTAWFGPMLETIDIEPIRVLFEHQPTDKPRTGKQLSKVPR